MHLTGSSTKGTNRSIWRERERIIYRIQGTCGAPSNETSSLKYEARPLMRTCNVDIIGKGMDQSIVRKYFNTHNLWLIILCALSSLSAVEWCKLSCKKRNSWKVPVLRSARGSGIVRKVYFISPFVGYFFKTITLDFSHWLHTWRINSCSIRLSAPTSLFL